jgi:serine protease Do
MERYFLSSILLLMLCSCTKSLKEIITDAEAATFTIYTYDEYGTPTGSGSGFFIDSQGTGITNYHVLDGSVKATLKTFDGEMIEIDKVVASDRDWDILKFTTINKNQVPFKYLTFAKAEMERGDAVYNISTPMGLENTISEGIVSSVREDKQHGSIVQITAPISPGSSGSALLNKQGKVFAVATFNRGGGQNLNFGVAINEQKLSALTKNDFERRNSKFNQKENFILINEKEENRQDVTLNALEFKDDATIAYFSYTNLNMASSSYYIWCELDKKDEGFLIHDLERNKKYYLTSSTIGVDKANGTEVDIASNYKFKVYFPPIKDKLRKIDIAYGYTSRGWIFRNIDLDKYRQDPSVDMVSYQKEYAYSTMHKGSLSDAISIFNTVLEEKPDDIEALNAMGIISYVTDNNRDAEYYFTEAIDAHPNNTIAYINRSVLHKNKKEYQSALQDINTVINIDNKQPDNYVFRGMLYLDMKNYVDAEADLTKAISSADFKKDEGAYMYRALCRAALGKNSLACNDIEIAYNLTNDPDTEKILQDMWNQCGCNR